VQDLAVASAQERTCDSEAAYRAQQRIKSELKAVRRAAAVAEADVRTLGKSVQQLERQTLLYGDLQHYLKVIELEVEDICDTLQHIAEAQAASRSSPPWRSGGVDRGSPAAASPAGHGSARDSGTTHPRRV
jgi:hypothetical protein